MKAFGNIAVTIISYAFLSVGIGWLLAGFFPSFNRLGVTLTYAAWWGFYTYLIIRSRTPFNDGLSSEQGANAFSWFLASLATSIIFMAASVGWMFFLVTGLIFLSVAIVHSIVIYKNREIVQDGSLLEIILARCDKNLMDKSGSELKGNPNERPRSEYLADLTLSVVNTSGAITAAIAFIMYELGWLVHE